MYHIDFLLNKEGKNMYNTIEESIASETVGFLIEALQNSNREFLEYELRTFADENRLEFDRGSSRYVLIDRINHFVIKIAVNSFGIDQNETEAKYSGEPYVTKVIENYNNVIIVTPEYEMLINRIHAFLNEPDFYNSLKRGESETNDILFDILANDFNTKQEAIYNEDDFIIKVMDNIALLPNEYPQDVHEENFGIDFLSDGDKPIMLDNGIDYAFCETHYDVISEECYTPFELLYKLFENQKQLETS